MHALIEAIDAELPQTQCGKCGHPGCRPYAEAIADGEAINRCPPGGEATVVRLAELTRREPQPLEQPAQSPLVAFVREAECIGCTKCIQACPVDAILGAAKQMHTVIVDECTGCELCVAPCPVDCIDLLPHPHWQAASNDAERESYLARRAIKGRQRFLARNRRLAAEADRKRRDKRPEAARRAAPTPPPDALSPSALRANRIRMVAALKRLTRQQDDPQLSAEERSTLTQRIQEHRAQLATLDRRLADAPTPPSAEARRAPTEHQRRMAVNAARQALRKAQQQLAHAERQQDREAENAARSQIDQASRMLNAAQHTLDATRTPR